MALKLEPEIEAAEARCLQARREKAFGTTAAPVPPDPDRLPDDVVGLAVSGGGLRSATYNLGFLQALTRHGLLRQVDYLVSVSGGGYTAGHVAALATGVAEEGREFHAAANEDHLLGVDANEAIVDRCRFRHVGDYLKEYALFLRMYLLGTIPMLAMFLSGLGMVAAVLALLWRCLDYTEVREIFNISGIAELGVDWTLGDETIFAFMPAMLCFALLVVARGVAWLSRWRWAERATRAMVWVFLGSLAVSLAVVLGNGVSTLNRSSDLENIQSYFWLPITIITSICLLPLLGTRRILQSGHADAPLWQHRVFQFVSVSSSIALPFFMMYLIARENVSGYATYRSSKLVVDDVKDWHSFLELLDDKDGAGAKDGPLVAALSADEVPSSEELKALRDQIKEVEAEQYRLTGYDPWERHQSIPVRNPIDGTRTLWNLTMGTKAEAWRNYRTAWNQERNKEAEFLETTLNPYLDPNPRPLSDQENALSEDGRKQVIALNEKQRGKFTARLMQLVAIQATGGEKAKAEPSAAKEGDAVEKIRPDVAFAADNRTKVRAFVDDRSKQLLEGSKLKDLWLRATVDHTHEGAAVEDAVGELGLTPREHAEFNRLLLEFLYPKIIKERTQPSTPTVVAQDQRFRLYFAITCAIVFVVTMSLDINWLCPIFTYYNHQIQQYFVASAQTQRDNPGYNPSISSLTPWKSGAPFPIMLASYYFFAKIGKEGPRAAGSQPGDWARVWPFLLTPKYSGSELFGFHRTGDSGSDLPLSEAMAISGSALSPFMVEHLGFAAIMTSLNLRIGRWLKVKPAPGSEGPPLAARVTGWSVLAECLHSFRSDYSKAHVHQALAVDGGFYEFFGLEELLRRRSRIIILSDAGCNNGQYEFGSLADVVRLIRERHGVEVLDLDNDAPPNLSLLRRNREHNRQPVSFLCLRVRYPATAEQPSHEGLLVYCQMSLTGREQLDLQQFRNSNPNFPDEPISNQFFDFRKVESYRQLGYYIGKCLCRCLPSRQGRVPLDELQARLVNAYLSEAYDYCRANPSESRALPGAEVARLARSGSFRLLGSHLSTLSPAEIAHHEMAIDDALSSFERDPDQRDQALRLFESGQLPQVDRDADVAGALAEVAKVLLAIHSLEVGWHTAGPFQLGGRERLKELLATHPEHFNWRLRGVAAVGQQTEPSSAPWHGAAQAIFTRRGPEIFERLEKWLELLAETHRQRPSEQTANSDNSAQIAQE